MYLGTLCARGHDNGGGKSLRHDAGHCAKCVSERRKIVYWGDPAAREDAKRRRNIHREKNAEAQAAYDKEYKEKNRELLRQKAKARYWRDPELARAQATGRRQRDIERSRARDCKWRRELRAKNPEAVRAYANAHYAKNRERLRLRSLVNASIRRGRFRKPCGSLLEIGMDPEAIIKHMGPCPGPRHEWEIDHIRPLCSFDLGNVEDLRAAFAPENHRWLPKIENRIKGGRYAKST